MAPTETLAEQHFATLQALMPGELVQAALLTGSTPAARRTDLLGKLATGELKLLVGTHALIEEAVEFDRLAVAVVDEQHRFGVNQRRALDRKAPAALAAARAAHDRDADPAHARAHRLRRPRRHRAARAAGRAGARSTRTWPPASASARAPTSASARSCAPAARRSSSARWSRSPRRCRRAPRRPSSSACGDRAARLPRRAAARAEAPAREAGGDGGVRRRRRRRARGDDGDRGRHRRPERDGDARRERRALRDLAAAPAARAHRPRRARVGVRAVRAQGVAAAARARRAPRRLQARRDRPRAARRGGDARHAPVRPRTVPGRAAARGRRAARAGADAGAHRCSTPTRELARPSTRCSRTRCTPPTGRTRSSRSRRKRLGYARPHVPIDRPRRTVAVLLDGAVRLRRAPGGRIRQEAGPQGHDAQRLPRRRPDPARRRAGPGRVRAGCRAALPDRPKQRLPDPGQGPGGRDPQGQAGHHRRPGGDDLAPRRRRRQGRLDDAGHAGHLRLEQGAAEGAQGRRVAVQGGRRAATGSTSRRRPRSATTSASPSAT